MIYPELTRIEPVFVPRIWGTQSLAPIYPDRVVGNARIGEVWLTGNDCVIASGPYKGRKLGDAWSEMKTLWRGTLLRDIPEFPFLIKFIFPADKLSIQVHPDDTYASAHERTGGCGKTEMWHALSADSTARVLIGMKAGVDKRRFLEALNSQTLEDLLQNYVVRSGDTFFLPAGTPHTIGPGMVLCEIQQNSDLTYRVYDYGRVEANGRPRELHIEKALEVIKFGESGERKVPSLELSREGLNRRLLAACKYFVGERWEFSAPTELFTNGEFFIAAVVISGRGHLKAEAQDIAYQCGQTWFIPACLAPPTCIPDEPTTLIIAYVPDLQNLKDNLLDQGLGDSKVAQSVFL